MNRKNLRLGRITPSRMAMVCSAACAALAGCGGGDAPQSVLSPSAAAPQASAQRGGEAAVHVVLGPEELPLPASMPVAHSGEEGQFTDRMVLKYKPEVTQVPWSPALNRTNRLALQLGLQLSPVREMSGGVQVVHLGTRLTLAQAASVAQALRMGDPNLEYAEPDVVLRPSYVPNDPYFPHQWGLVDSAAGVNATSAWDISRGAGVTVAVIDTGYTVHSDLAANILPGYDMISSVPMSGDGDGRDANAADEGDFVATRECGSGSSARSSSWHGTHVAGIVAALGGNKNGISGVAPQAKILPVRALGKCGGYMSDIADGITWAAGGAVSGVPANAHPAKVINLSLGGVSSCGTYVQSAVNFARSKGALVVVSAGNGNSPASTQTPANCVGVLAVGATSLEGGKATYSNYGPTVGVSAPGGDVSKGILSTLNTGATKPVSETYAFYMGTSMAAPTVSGVAALMLAANRALTPDQMIDAMKKTAKPLPVACGQGCGAGIVNAKAAVALAAGLPPPPPPPPPPPTPPPPPATGTFTEVEPNDELAKAQSLYAVNATLKGGIATPADVDYYRYPLENAGKVKFTLKPGDSRSGLSLGIYNSAGGLIIRIAGVVGVSPTAGITNLSGARTDLMVKVERTVGVVSPYTLTALR